MNAFLDMVWVELRKALRSRMPIYLTLGSLFMPLGIAFLIFLSRNSEISQKLGLLGPKANLVAYSTTNWASYLALLGQMLAVGGFFICVMIVSWVFGREFVDGTLKDMWAVPVARASILMAKFSVVAILSAAVCGIIFILGLVLGAVMGLPEGSPEVILRGSAWVLGTAGLTIAVITPFALFASIGRGYLLPIGLAVLMVIMANVLGAAGWGDYFPWSIAALFAQGKGDLAPVSFVIVALTCLAGLAGTYLWWMYADQNR